MSAPSFPSLLSPEAAREVVLSHSQSLSTETISHSQALNRTLAADVVSTVQLPPFDNSAMDGYAVVAHDLNLADETTPVRLKLLETIGAGEVASQTVSSGRCLKIMTGAPLPAGADAVVMREETRQNDSIVGFLASATQNQNIRRAGSDVEKGEIVLRAGTIVKAAQWAMLASLGAAQIEVFQTPRVGLIITGAELVDVETSLEAGQIRDSNSWALRGLVEATGAQIVAQTRVGDSPEELLEVLRDFSSRCDLVVTSGGVSAGDFDPVRDVLRDHARVHFWKIAMKPGKPVMFAHFNEIPIFGLPGNPVSVMVAFEEFVRPAILKMSGRRALRRVEVPAELAEPIRHAKGRTEFVRAHIQWENHRFVARITGDQSSGRLSNMMNANALLVVSAEMENLTAGQTLPARLLEMPEVE